ncbi:CBO0543 family protein [Ammoniphilus sp. CFH 90114]|uniref:CBO0543 family protein n=1 Tax=Ammoniphilus sp. CFH 90114 TaxID=2493665 RepID=UPI00100FAF94|nr:CBO0543 family protein [Ammoniphilus sp. CFH 90114]RXT03868.1 hypothetical protein EIZ39_22140 [Ammoniphilus sp. CFH 90114]
MNIILLVVYIVVGYKYGKWTNFHQYYPTLLFFVSVDLLSQFLLFDFTLWGFSPLGKMDEWFHLNHTLIALSKMAIQYPVTIALFLGHVTQKLKNQFLLIVLWSGIYAANEWIAQYFGVLTYHHGWHFGWDIAFNFLMFFMLLLHYQKPLVAWILCIPIILGIWEIFNIPFSVLK